MENCCNQHDLCYDTCNSDKELCDIEFKRCLYKYCDSYEKSIVNDIMVKGCKAAAKMLFTGTLTLGCKSYLDSQERACYCPSTTGSNYENNDRNSAGNRKDYNRGKQKPSAPPENNNQNQNQKNRNYGWKNMNDL